MSKIVIIGGGASALSCCINTKKNVTILEKNDILGKKILATGNGRCNYFNENYSSNHYNSSSYHNLDNLIGEESKREIKDFFNKIGLIPRIKDGYYYPISNEAKSVREILINSCSKNTNIKLNTVVIDIKKKDDKFLIYTNSEVIEAEKVVIATGGKSCPKYGNDGNLYKIIENLGHKIVKPLPSLVQLIGESKVLKKWKGIRNEVNLSLYENDKLVKEETGEIQLTDYGISGICTMQLSSVVSRGIYNKNKEEILINFMPFLKENFIDFFTKRDEIITGNLYQLFLGLVNSKLIKILLEDINIDYDRTWNSLSLEEKKKLENEFTKYLFKVVGTKDFNDCQTTTGGVRLDEVDINTFQSKIVKNLYIIGEILDIDGECGGYNLGFAWVSGIKAGKNI